MVTLSKPSAGDTDWTTEINTNWQSIQDIIGTDMTQGSVLFAGASGVYSQDNSNLFWDDTNNRFGIGTNSLTASLTVADASAGNIESFRTVNTTDPGTTSAGILETKRLFSAGGTEYSAVSFEYDWINASTPNAKYTTRISEGGTPQIMYECAGNNYHKRRIGGTELERLTSAGLRIEPDGVSADAQAALHVKDDSGVPAYFERNTAAGWDEGIALLNLNSPGAAGSGIYINFEARDNASNWINQSRFGSRWADASEGATDGRVTLQTMEAGTIRDVYNVYGDATQRWALGNTEQLRLSNGDGLRIEPGGIAGGAEAPLHVVNTSTDVLLLLEIQGGGIAGQDYFRDDATPSNGDVVSEVRHVARDSALNADVFAKQLAYTDVVTSGAEIGSLHFHAMDAGTLRNQYEMKGGTHQRWWIGSTEVQRLTSSGLRIEPDGIAGGASYALHVVDDTTMPMYVQRSASGSKTIAEFNNRNSPGAAATGVHLDFYFLDSVGSATRFNYMEFMTLDVTNGSEDGRTRLWQQVGGTESSILDIQADNLGFNGASFGSGQGVMFLADAGTNPSSNPSAGGILYSDSGAGKWRGSSGTTTTFGAADPHCPRCGLDFAHEWENTHVKKKLSVCAWCLTEALGKLGHDIVIEKSDS